MSKNEFIDRLAQLLADVSPEERDEGSPIIVNILKMPDLKMKKPFCRN